MAQTKTADERVTELYSKLRTHFVKAAKRHPEVAKQFNQIITAIDQLDSKPGSFTDPKSKKRLESLSVGVYIAYMEAVSKNEHDDVRAEFRAARPMLDEIEELTAVKKPAKKAAPKASSGVRRRATANAGA